MCSKGGEMQEAREQMKFRVVASTRLLAMVRDKVRECAERAGVPDKITHQVVLAADEAVTNVITHAYDNDGVSEVEVDVSVGSGKIQLTIRDTAEFFDPTDYTLPDIDDHVKSGKKRGLGIFLMRKIMDEVTHRVVDDKINELVLVKNITTTGG
jgi:serine/threonine-protein kinase RsbW